MNFDQMRAELLKRSSATKSSPTEYAVTKADEEHRYTLGPLYVPGARDSDNEYAEAQDLQSACWDYIRKGNRRIRDTHTEAEIGELVEMISWPYETVTETKLGDGTVKKYKLPAGTVYCGVIWDPPAWELVKSGKLRGYSLGGSAVRVKEASNDDDMPRMRDLLADAEPEAQTTQREVVFTPEPEAVAATKDAFIPIVAGNRVALTDGKGGVTKQEGRVEATAVGGRGQILYDVAWDDGDHGSGLPEYFLRNITPPTRST